MSKGDFPALRMTVDGGRLVPATSFDQERLNSYRRGTVVFVKFTEERDRVLVRKWFAILGLVLKQCDTPWKNKDEAHEAIKLALGIVNLSKTVSGKFMQYPKSLAELDEPEMLDALEQMTELLSRMTGVDVATLKKEAADVGHELDTPDTPSGEAPSSPSPDDAAAPSVASEADDSAAPVPSSASIDQARADLMECVRKLFAIIVDDSMTVEGRRGVLETAKNDWKVYLPEDLHGSLKSIFLSADACLRGHAKRSTAIAEFAAWLECQPEEIGS